MLRQEKPKRRPHNYDFLRRIGFTLVFVIVVGLPLSLFAGSRVASEQLIDMLLIGVMICAALYLLYQAALWLLYSVLYPEESAPASSEFDNHWDAHPTPPQD